LKRQITISVDLPINDTRVYDYTLYADNGRGIYLVSTNLDTTNGTFVRYFPIDGNIILVFNKNASKVFTESSGYIWLSSFGYLDLDADVTFDGTTVTIKPPADLTADQQYELVFLIYSTIPDDYYYDDIHFRTEP
jgi:hypothetical protein